MTKFPSAPAMTNKKRSVRDIEDAFPCDSMKFIEQFDVIKRWRKGRVADVDIFGCDKLADESADAKVREGGREREGKCIVILSFYFFVFDYTDEKIPSSGGFTAEFSD